MTTTGMVVISTSPVTPRPSPSPTVHAVSAGSRLPRFLLAAVFVVAAAIAIIQNTAYRALEAQGAALVLRPFVDGHVTVGHTSFWIVTDEFARGFQVTAECTAVILIAPLMLLAAALLIVTTSPAWRILAGTVTMYVIITTTNAFRLALIGWSSMTWGMTYGYTISHTFVGSVIGILGFVTGLAALVLIASPRRRRG